MTPDADRSPDDDVEDVEVRIVEDPEPADGDFDRRLTDLLGRLLDTETRGKVYVQVLRDPETTSEEVARATGLYPETVRRTVADLRAEGVLDRRELEGAEGRYGYTAIPPSELVDRLLSDVRTGLDVFFEAGSDSGPGTGVDPVTIDVEDAPRRGGDDRGREGREGSNESDGGGRRDGADATGGKGSEDDTNDPDGTDDLDDTDDTDEDDGFPSGTP